MTDTVHNTTPAAAIKHPRGPLQPVRQSPWQTVPEPLSETSPADVPSTSAFSNQARGLHSNQETKARPIRGVTMHNARSTVNDAEPLPTSPCREVIDGNWHGLDVGSPFWADSMSTRPTSGNLKPVEVARIHRNSSHLGAAEGLALAIGLSASKANSIASCGSEEAAHNAETSSLAARRAASPALPPPDSETAVRQTSAADKVTASRPRPSAKQASAKPVADREGLVSEVAAPEASGQEASSARSVHGEGHHSVVDTAPTIPLEPSPVSPDEVAAAAAKAADVQRTRAIASLQKPLEVVTRQKTLIRYAPYMTYEHSQYVQSAVPCSVAIQYPLSALRRLCIQFLQPW